MLGYFLAISLIPLIVVGIINLITARNILLRTEAGYLQTIAKRQIHEIKTYLEEVSDFVTLVSESPDIANTLSQLKNVDSKDLVNLESDAHYNKTIASISSPMERIVSRFGFSQLYLINPKSIIVFSVPHLDASNLDLENGPQKTSELAKVFQRTMDTLQPQTGDFRMFKPTGTPSLFISAPVLSKGNIVGSIVFGIDNKELNSKLSNFIGMGETGEILFASKDENQIILLNDLRHKNSPAFKNRLVFEPENDKPLTPIQKAVRGQKGHGLQIDTDGKEVLALWDYLPDLRIGIVLKVDKAEIYSRANHLSYLAICVAGITFLFVMLAAFLLSRSITKPLNTLTKAANQLANGDLTGEISCNTLNEVGELSNATRIMSKSLKSLVKKVKITGSEIANTAQFLSASAQKQVDAAETTDLAAINASTSAKKISTTATELVSTMQEVNVVTQKTALKAESGLDVLSTIEASMQQLSTSNTSVSDQLALIQQKANAITGVISTMTKVADQTNLLSLNAAIEARKAGDYGRGFTIVATEIRRLADQAATSTLDIEQSVREMLGAVRTGVKGMEGFSTQVSKSVKEITEISSRLTEVIQQVQGLPPRFDQILEGMNSQTIDANVINDAMNNLTNSSQQTASAVKETQRMLDNLRRSSELLEAEISKFKT